MYRRVEEDSSVCMVNVSKGSSGIYLYTYIDSGRECKLLSTTNKYANDI